MKHHVAVYCVTLGSIVEYSVEIVSYKSAKYTNDANILLLFTIL